jgi:hypothetical protein
MKIHPRLSVVIVEVPLIPQESQNKNVLNHRHYYAAFFSLAFIIQRQYVWNMSLTKSDGRKAKLIIVYIVEVVGLFRLQMW